MRKPQTSMGEMRNENDRLKDENDHLESESSQRSDGPLQRCYKDLPQDSFMAQNSIDLNSQPPSEKPFEGALFVLNTMYARPVEFSGQTKIIDLAFGRPTTRFSAETPSLPLLGLDPQNNEHAFFAECYLKFHTDPSFCPNGIMPHNSAVISLPPGGAFPPRASILKKTPRQFRKLFLSQQSPQLVSLTENKHLNLKEGGGLLQDDPLPKEVHVLLANVLTSTAYKNPTVPLISQFLTYLQQGLVSLDDILLKYSSPVYNCCPLRVREYKRRRSTATQLQTCKHPNHGNAGRTLQGVRFAIMLWCPYKLV
jgi:hypothetical protein